MRIVLMLLGILYAGLGAATEPEAPLTEDAVGESASAVATAAGVAAAGPPPGTEGTVDESQE